MANQRWLDRLAAELAAQALTAGERARLLEELRDHLADLEGENGMDATNLAVLDERLGRPAVLAEQAGATYRRGFWRRHPALTFLLGPVLTVLGGIVGYELLLVGLLLGYAVMRPEAVPVSARELWWARVLFGGVVVVPFAATAWLFCRLTHRHGRGWGWGLTACGILAVLAGWFQPALSLPPAGAIHGSVAVGLGFQVVPRLGQLVVPLLAGAAFAGWPRRRGPRAQLGGA
jgi:hypothetical protein